MRKAHALSLRKVRTGLELLSYLLACITGRLMDATGDPICGIRFGCEWFGGSYDV